MPNKYVDNFFGMFKNPYELLCFYDDEFREGIYKLYPWQIEILKRFSLDVPADDMIRMAIIAANGSGKSQYILAPCAAWMAVVFEKSLSYVTSSSASQLDTQTERFLDSLAYKMNKKHRDEFGAIEDVWKIKQRQKVFNPTGSFIDLFATDEPKKAEGKHPLYPGGEFAIFVDEGKSIEPAIYGAIDRCTGATRRLDISSAGEPIGHFYDICTKPELGWWMRKIIYKDCPHIKETEFQQAVKKHGINDPLVRSIFFSEFISTEQTTVITREAWDRCRAKFNENRVYKLEGLRMGVDLAGGGDECAVAIWNGNVMIGLETWRFFDTAQSAKEVIDIQHKYGVPDSGVWIEYDGFNRGVVDALLDQGHNYNKVVSNSKAIDSKRYSNRATELWFQFKRFVEEGYVALLPDQQLKDQFCSRYYKRSRLTSKIQLESKQEARLNGHPSPDRADATVFAWAGMPMIDEFLENNVNVKPETVNRFGRKIPANQLEEEVDKWTYGESEFLEERAGMVGVSPKNIYGTFSELEKQGNTNYFGEN